MKRVEPYQKVLLAVLIDRVGFDPTDRDISPLASRQGPSAICASHGRQSWRRACDASHLTIKFAYERGILQMIHENQNDSPAVASDSMVPAGAAVYGAPSMGDRAGSARPAHSDATGPAPRTPWPRIGGRDFRAAPNSGFLPNLFSQPLIPSGRQRAIYVAGCPALSVIARKLGAPVYRIATCAPDQLREHVAGLAASGPVYPSSRRHGVPHGWEAWFPVPVAARRLPSPASPVRCGERSLIIDLPEGLSGQDFDRAFLALVRKGAIEPWLSPGEGPDGDPAIRLNSVILHRRHGPQNAADLWPDPTSALVAFNPGHQADGDRLVALVEKVLLDFGASCFRAGRLAA